MTQKTKIIGVFVAIVAAILIWNLLNRSKTETDAEETSAAQKGETVAAVAKVQRGTIQEKLVIAGAFKPFQEVDVHAKVAGYIRTIYVDVGDHVKEGQTLAVLEIPELTAELAGADASVRRSKEEIRRAQGDVERSKYTHAASHSMYDRLKQAAQQKSGLVAQQELDDAQAKDLEQEAQVASSQAALSAAEQQLQVAEANQKQYNALSNYSRIVAPFAGVVTTRYADTGALIAAGTSSSAQSMPIVKLTQVSKLRLVLPIPESMAAQIHLKDPVNVHVQALNQDIVGKVSRFADSLDLQTRTMETEIDFENADGKLIPGMYAETTLVLSEKKDALLVPIEAVSQNGNDATVLAVNPQNIVEERHIKPGIQDKAHIQIVSGLTEQDRVVIGNRSQFRNGEKITPREAPAQTPLQTNEPGGAD